MPSARYAGAARATPSISAANTPMRRLIQLTPVVLVLALLQAHARAQPPADFSAEYARLKQGRTYARDVKTGALKKRHGAYPYWLVVPASYDPAKRYQVRFQLHGGVMRDDSSLRRDGTVRLPGDEQIYVMPAGWSGAPWWSDAQVTSLRRILEDVKAEYNVDENRVVIAGVSDGGTGAFYIACATPRPMRRSSR